MESLLLLTSTLLPSRLQLPNGDVLLNSRDWSGEFLRVIQLSKDNGNSWQALPPTCCPPPPSIHTSKKNAFTHAPHHLPFTPPMHRRLATITRLSSLSPKAAKGVCLPYRRPRRELPPFYPTPHHTTPHHTTPHHTAHHRTTPHHPHRHRHHHHATPLTINTH